MSSEPDIYLHATLANNLPTVTFPPRPYHRRVTNIVVGNGVASSVTVYRGQLGSTPVAQNSNGQNNTLSGSISLPAGQQLFVQWSAADNPVSTAFARASFERSDSPLDSVPDTQVWSTNIVTSLVVGDPTSGEIVIEQGLPTALQDFYSAFTISAVTIRLMPADGSYFYIIAGSDPNTGNDFAAMGNAKPGALVATDIDQQWFSFFNGGTNIGQIELGDTDHDQRILVHSNFTQFGGSGLRGDIDMYGIFQSLGGHDIHIFGGGANLVETVLIAHGADFFLGDGTNPTDVQFGREGAGSFYFQNTNVDFLLSGLLSAPWNHIEYGLVTAGAVATAVNGGPEVAIPAASWAHEPNPTFKNGRLYRCTLQYGTGINVAGSISGRVRVRKGSASIAGQLLGETNAQQQNANVFLAAPPLVFYVQNFSGADITTKLSVTAQWTSGAAGQFRLYGEALGGAFGVPMNLTIEDIGKAGPSQFGNLAVSIV